MNQRGKCQTIQVSVFLKIHAVPPICWQAVNLQTESTFYAVETGGNHAINSRSQYNINP